MTTILLATRTWLSTSFPSIKTSRAKPFSTTALTVPLTASAAAGRASNSGPNINVCSKSRIAILRAQRGASFRRACQRHISANVTRPAMTPVPRRPRGLHQPRSRKLAHAPLMSRYRSGISLPGPMMIRIELFLCFSLLFCPGRQCCWPLSQRGPPAGARALPILDLGGSLPDFRFLPMLPFGNTVATELRVAGSPRDFKAIMCLPSAWVDGGADAVQNFRWHEVSCALEDGIDKRNGLVLVRRSGERPGSRAAGGMQRGRSVYQLHQQHSRDVHCGRHVLGLGRSLDCAGDGAG